MVEICQVRPTRHKFLNYYTPDVIFDIRADISVQPILTTQTNTLCFFSAKLQTFSVLPKESREMSLGHPLP